MKRILLVLCIAMTAGGWCTAQVVMGTYIQRGAATRDLPDEGMNAAHSVLSLNSKAIISNPLNNKEVEVTIIDRIPPSLNRIIDLSPQAAAALDLQSGGQVIVMVPRAPVSRPFTAQTQTQTETNGRQPPSPDTTRFAVPLTLVPMTEHGTDREGAGGFAPTDIDIYLDIHMPETPVAVSGSQEPERPSAMPPKSHLPVSTDNAVEPRIRPRLPDRNSGKIYNLQVGAFAVLYNAEQVCQRLRSAGFTARIEEYGLLNRVFAANIPAADIYSTARRLGELGFREVWVRE